MIAAGSACIRPTAGFFFSFFLFLSLSKGLFLLFFLSSSSCNSKNVSVPLFLLLSPLFLLSMFSPLLFIVPSVPILLLLYYSSYITPPILHLTPYQVNPLNHPPPPHPWNHPFHHLHPHHSSLG